MDIKKVRPDPEGTSKSRRAKGSRCWTVWKKVFVIFMIGGALIYGLSVHVIRSEAAASCQFDDEIPKNIKEYCEEIGQAKGICPELLEAIAWHESRFIPTVKNKNCYGLMQINVKIHQDRIENLGYTSKDMLKAKPNIEVAADYLAELYEDYGDENPIVLSLYSGAGWDAVEKYKEYGFITDYVDDILTRSAKYERLHGK